MGLRLLLTGQLRQTIVVEVTHGVHSADTSEEAERIDASPETGPLDHSRTLVDVNTRWEKGGVIRELHQLASMMCWLARSCRREHLVAVSISHTRP